MEYDDDEIITNFCYHCVKKVRDITSHKKWHERMRGENDKISWITKKCHIHSNMKTSSQEIRDCGLCKIFPIK